MSFWTTILCAACVLGNVLAAPTGFGESDTKDPCDGYQEKCEAACANKGQRLTKSKCVKTMRVSDGVPTTEANIKCDCIDPKVVQGSANLPCNEFFDQCKFGCHSESLGSMMNVQCRVKTKGTDIEVDKESSTCGCQQGTLIL